MYSRLRTHDRPCGPLQAWFAVLYLLGFVAYIYWREHDMDRKFDWEIVMGQPQADPSSSREA